MTSLTRWLCQTCRQSLGVVRDGTLLPSVPAVVTITIRQARGKQPDSDGLVILPKAVRDSIAAWFGVDDGPAGPIEWCYGWVRGSRGRLAADGYAE